MTDSWLKELSSVRVAPDSSVLTEKVVRVGSGGVGRNVAVERLTVPVVIKWWFADCLQTASSGARWI